jgi:hypothetical protein
VSVITVSAKIAAMIDRVTGNEPLPASVRHDIIERTDGIPLFIEEMTKAVLEAEIEGEARNYCRLRSILGSCDACELARLLMMTAPRAAPSPPSDRACRTLLVRS